MTIVAPVPVATTADTVTFNRAEWDAYLDRLEDESDRASIAAERAERERLGPAEYDRLCYTLAESRRMTDGLSAVAIWRERAGLTQRALAAAAEVSQSYLAEIEAKRKPGSAAALSRLAKVLNVPLEHLVAEARDA